MTIVIAAAGTGGHVYPALAVGEALVDRGAARDDVIFFGGDRLAADAVPAAGFPFVAFDLPRLRRSWTVDNLRIPLALRRATRAMAIELGGRAAGVVLGMSGYVTVPAAMAARRRRLPFLLQEQNASPGLAARFAARRAVVTFLGLPGPATNLPRSRLVGNPLRRSLAGFDRSELRQEAFRRYGLGTGAVVLGVLGGSLGARVLNETVPSVAGAMARGAIVHLTGPDALDDMMGRAEGCSLPWRCLGYEDRMDLFYASADLVLCRAGAMTISELAATATPAVLVPLESVGQQANAAAMEAAGGAVVVPQARVAELPGIVARTLGDADALGRMAVGAGSLNLADGAGIIADAVLEAVRG